jgi:hypothetical protein
MDTNLFKRWYSYCKQEHEDCNYRSTTPAFPIKLIDCKTRELINSDTEYFYVALSYVWGASTSIENEYFNGSKIVQCLPETIEGAITVTLNLNMRYLWIDRYCIYPFRQRLLCRRLWWCLTQHVAVAGTTLVCPISIHTSYAAVLTRIFRTPPL